MGCENYWGLKVTKGAELCLDSKDFATIQFAWSNLKKPPFGNQLPLVFVDLRKACDSILVNQIWNAATIYNRCYKIIGEKY